MKKIFFLIVIALCINTSAYATATAELQNCKAQNYKEYIIRHYMTSGFAVQIHNDYSLTAVREINDTKTKILMKMIDGAKTNNRMEFQYNYNIIQNGSNTLVQLTITAVSDSGTVMQRITNIDPKNEVAELNAVNSNFIGNRSSNDE